MRDAPCPVIVVGILDELLDLNEVAAVVLRPAHPGARFDDVAPSWLMAAHRDREIANGPASGQIAGRSYEAYATFRHDGGVVWWLIDVTAHRAVERVLQMERDRTTFLAYASNLLLATLNVERCMELTAQLAADYLADGAVVILPPAGRRLLTMTSCQRDGQVTHRVANADPATVPGLDMALQGFPPVPSQWIDPGGVPGWAVPAEFGVVGSAAVVPLPGHGAPAGALMLLRRSERAAFSENEEVVARLFAARAGAAMSAARLYAEQTSITEILMRDLMPPLLQAVDGIEFAGGYQASGVAEHVGGDFYDLHPARQPGEESLLVLGDVCGKGLEAAALTGKIRNTLQALIPLAGDHKLVLDLLNRALISSLHTRFATLVLASAVRVGPNVRLRLSSAGHLPPLILRADGTVEEAETRGTLVGVLPQMELTSAVVELAPSETCLLYTDGVTEAKGGPLGDSCLGAYRLKAALAECAGIPSEATVERIHMLATQWVGTSRHDDIAIAAVTAPRSRDAI
ncbi:MAG: PP2C family protein-serine/threonine phosphatase [Kibdelosporangium sp.]